MEHSSLTGKNTRKETSRTRPQARSPERDQRPDEEFLAARPALEAILAGAGMDQLKAGAVQALAARAGNSALLGLLARRQTGPRLVPGPPEAQPATRPLTCRPDPPQLEAAPDWDGAAMPAQGPLEV